MDEFLTFMEDIHERQKVFQRIRENIDLEQLDERQVNIMSEQFLNRASQEIIELLRTLPEGVLGQKNERIFDRTKMMHELSDTVLFLINFMILKKITWTELLAAMTVVQDNNFAKCKLRLHRELNDKDAVIDEQIKIIKRRKVKVK